MVSLILISLITCGVGSILYYFWAKRQAIVDIPNERSSHLHQPVRGLGIVFPIACALMGILSLYTRLLPLEIEEIWIRPVLIPLGIVLAGLTGYLDDRLDLRATIRLPLYALSVGLVLFASSPLSYISFLGAGIALIVLVGIINTYNFMDGINGITGLYSIVFFGSMLYYLNDCNPNLLGFTEVLLIPALCFYIVFGVFNYRKTALAFLGDAGSIGTGLLVSTCLILLFVEFQSIHVLSLLLVYGVDSVGTILIRLIRRENIFKAHRSHFYQDLVHKIGFSHIKVSFVYALIQLCINVLYFTSVFHPMLIFMVSLVILCAIYLIGKHHMGQLNLKLLK